MSVLSEGRYVCVLSEGRYVCGEWEMYVCAQKGCVE